MNTRRHLLRTASTLSIAGLLSACGFGSGTASTPVVVLPIASALPTIPSAATATAPTAVISMPTVTTVPPTAAPPTAVPPTAVPPTAAPPATSRPAPQALLGPEWIVLANGDLYATGVETVVAYRASGLRPGTIPAEYADFRLLADQVVAVQRNAQGQPWVRMLVTPGQAFLNGSTTPFNPWGAASNRIAGYLLALTAPSAPIRLQPINAQGSPIEQGLVFAWNSAGGQFEVSTLVLPPTAQPATATTQPATATTQPVIPVLVCEPGAGGPGTSVTVNGTGYTPGMGITIRLGLPNPIGEVLATGSVSADGRFSATLVMPDRLPSGDQIAEGVIFLVAMDAENRALANAAFTFKRT